MSLGGRSASADVNEESSILPKKMTNVAAVPDDTTASCDSLISYAETLARTGHQWKEALDVLVLAGRLADFTADKLENFVVLLSDSWTKSNVTSFNQRNKNSHFSCSKCGGVLHEPVTTWCGHAYCKKCVDRDAASNCDKCGRQLDSPQQPGDFKSNVLVAALVEKFWLPDLQACKLRQEGNKLFSRSLVTEALSKYDQGALLGNATLYIMHHNALHNTKERIGIII